MTINDIVLALFATYLLFTGLRYLWGIATGDSVSAYGKKQLLKIEKVKRSKKSLWETHPFIGILTIIGTVVFVEPTKESKLKEQLSRAGLLYTPKEYMAKRVLFIFFGFALIFLIYSRQFYLGIPFGVIVAIYLQFRVNDELADKITVNNDQLLRELPQFVRSVISGLKTDRDIIRVIERFIPIAKPTLKPELETLVVDLKSGSVESALLHFDARLGLPEISRLVVILINIERGIDQANSLTYLANDMRLITRENTKRQYSLRPAKLMRALLPCILVDIVALMYVLIYNVLTGLHGLA